MALINKLLARLDKSINRSCICYFCGLIPEHAKVHTIKLKNPDTPYINDKLYTCESCHKDFFYYMVFVWFHDVHDMDISLATEELKEIRQIFFERRAAGLDKR